VNNYLGYVLAGLGGGAVVASLALGLVLCYRTSGVVNFAQAAMGGYVAFAYFEFRESGDVVLPLIGLPNLFHVITNPSLFSSLVFAVIAAALLGAAVYWLLFRPLRRAPALARIVASLGLMLYLQESMRIRFPTSGAAVVTRHPVLPEAPVRFLDTSVTQNRLLLALLVIIVTVVLWAVFRFTRFGLMTRAAAGNEKGALLIGIPSDRVALVNWVIASVITGLAVILIEPIAGLDPATTSLLVMPALAAALLGGLSSFAIATAAGLGIGMLQALILGYVVQPDTTWIPSWLPATGLQQAVPVVLILVALVWRGNALPDRSALVERSLPASPTPRHPLRWLVLLGGAASVGLLTFDAAHRQALIVSMVFALLALSVVVVTGYVGQISLAQLAFAGIAGFTVIGLGGRGLPFPIAAVGAALVATAVGVLVGLPAARVRGMSLAIATLAIAIAIEQLVLASVAFSGGPAGKSAPVPTLFGIDVGIFAPGSDNFRPVFGFVVLAVLSLACLGVANLRRNRTGLRWLAVRANERAAAAAGIDVSRAKVGAFAVSSFLAGLCGVLMAYSATTLSTTSFMVIGALVALAFTYLCGISSISGALLAGLLAQAGLLTVVTNGWTGGSAGEYVYAIGGLLLMVTAVTAPEGLTGLIRSQLARLRPHAPAPGDLGELTPAVPQPGAPLPDGQGVRL
jgi:branched-chain amino acid transport system permease protein